jgi:hypothetical protein
VLDRGIIMAKTIKLSDIRISESFLNSKPSERKIAECRDNWLSYGKQDRWVVVNHDNILVDGYIMYLVLKEQGIEDAQYKVLEQKHKRWSRKRVEDFVPKYRNTMTTYVYGKHPNTESGRIYVWRVPESWKNFSDKVQIGDKIYCKTKFGISPVIVSDIKVLDKCPVDIPVKKVCKIY